MMEISTSVLNVIGKENPTKIFYDLEVAKTDYYHIDVMDGKFVEKNTEKEMYEFSNTIKQISNLPLDVHLMVENVKEYIDKYASFEPLYITIHYEACKDKQEVREFLKYIQEGNIRCGLSIKPNTKLEVIYEFLPDISLLLIMSVEPGKGGQKFMPEALDKIQTLSEYIKKNNLDTYIEVDGGINKTNIKSIVNAGADILVVGSAIIEAKDYKKEIEDLKQ